MNAAALIEALSTIHKAHDALLRGVDSLRTAAHQAGHVDAAAALDAWRAHYRHPPVSAVLRAVEGIQHPAPEPEPKAPTLADRPPSPPPPAGGQGIPLQSGSIQ